MMYSFNLIEQPWIPCVQANGQVQELSLRQTLTRSREFVAMTGDTPLETAAIYRLLLAVLHSALRGPSNAKSWQKIWSAGTLDAPWLHEYLDQWKHRFDLFDPQRPFYQAADERARPKSIISLVMEMASGNNASLFDHHIESEGAVLSAAKAARALITAQNFSLCGTSGMEQKFTDCPWTRGVIFLASGDTLFALLALNLATAIVQQRIPVIGLDQPAWESDNPYLPDREIPLGYLDYLTWQNRRLLLIPEGEASAPTVSQFTVAPALRLSADVLDPMKSYGIDHEGGNKLVRFEEDRALWRDSVTFFNLRNPKSAKPPENFFAIASLAADYGYLPSSSVLRFIALGMANDQAKIEFLRQEQLPLPLAYLQDQEIVGILSDCLTQAEKAYDALQNAGKQLAVGIMVPKEAEKDWKKLKTNIKDRATSLYSHWGSDRVYWGALELPFFSLLEDLLTNREQALTNWCDEVQQAAWRAMDQAIEKIGESPTALKAAVKARSILGGKLKVIFGPIQKEVIQ